MVYFISLSFFFLGPLIRSEIQYSCRSRGNISGSGNHSKVWFNPGPALPAPAIPAQQQKAPSVPAQQPGGSSRSAPQQQEEANLPAEQQKAPPLWAWPTHVRHSGFTPQRGGQSPGGSYQASKPRLEPASGSAAEMGSGQRHWLPE